MKISPVNISHTQKPLQTRQTQPLKPSFSSSLNDFADVFGREATIMLNKLPDESVEKLAFKFRYEFIKEKFGKSHLRNIIADKIITKLIKKSEDLPYSKIHMAYGSYDEHKKKYAGKMLEQAVIPKIFENHEGKVYYNRLSRMWKTKVHHPRGEGSYRIELSDQDRGSLKDLIKTSKSYKELVTKIKETFNLNI